NFLMPKQPSFFQLLKDQAECLVEISNLFEDFAYKFSDFTDYAKKSGEIESRGDDKAHKMIDRINKTFITPLDREDLYTVTSEIDDIVDLLEDVIHNIQIYEVKEKKDFVEKFAQIIPKAANHLKELVEELEKLKYTKNFNALVIKIHDLEDQGDMIFSDGIERLFKEEKDPIEIIKWKEILENLEQIMDKFQDTSNTLEGIIVKSQ
ncbi:DUF47 family protein, partial [Patescibacteria group bacterium]|nr:DUF47 family protein [Patescibacteria group bacterium]